MDLSFEGMATCSGKCAAGDEARGQSASLGQPSMTIASWAVAAVDTATP
jgi:hypothetical protein